MPDLKWFGAALSLSVVLGGSAHATFVSLGSCTGGFDCQITSTPANPVTQNPNNGILFAWNELQNITLTENLRVDRVFDTTASFISDAGGGDFFIEAGTVVSSHYLQWDPGNGSNNRIETTISLDSQVFAFIIADQNLFDSDATLGLPELNYNDFTNRGLEGNDTTVFNGPNVDISWSASNPGDWTRLITAFSPGGEDNGGTSITEPNALALFGFGLAGLGLLSRRRKISRKKQPA